MNRFIRKSFASMALVCVMLTSLIPVASAATVTTSDTANHWAEPVITRWLKEGVIKGYDDGSFRPDHVITRAEAASLINRKLNITDAVEKKTFKDLASDAWQYRPLSAAVEAGYIKGYEDGTIRPDGVLTRQELAVVIHYILGLEANKEEVPFVDAAEIPLWSKEDIAAVAASHIMDGYADGTFAPMRTVTRAEAVVTLDRAASFLNKTGPVVYSTAGVHGPEQGKETVYQDVTISRQGVTLRNMTIYGDLLLGEGIGEGDVTLQNVTVHGQTTVKGGGANSIHFENSTLITVIIEKKNGEVRIVATGTTSVQTVDVRSSVTIQEDRVSGPGFRGVVLNSKLGDGTEVKLDGDFDTVQVDAKGTKVQLVKGSIVELGVAKDAADNEISLGEKGTVKQLIVYTVIHVKGQGTIEKANVNEGAEASTFEKMPMTVNDKPPAVPVAGGFGGFVPPQAPTPTPENISMQITASGYKKLEVSFSGAVDPATTTISIQNTTNIIGDVQYSTDHKHATLVMHAAISKGTYTIVVTSNKTGGFKTISQDVGVEAERVVSLAYVHDSAIWDQRTPSSIKVSYKLTNQYGEDATSRYGNEVKVSYSPIVPSQANEHPDQGSATIIFYRSLTENESVDLYAYYGDSLHVTKRLKVSKTEIPTTSPGTPFVFPFEVGGLYTQGNKALNVNSNLEDFSILFHWKGDKDLLSSNLRAFSSNNLIDVKRSAQVPVIGTVMIDNEQWNTLTLVRGNAQGSLTAGIYVISLIDANSGFIVSVLITVNSATQSSLAADAAFVIDDTLLAVYNTAGNYATSSWSLQGNVTGSVYQAQHVNGAGNIGQFTIQGSPIPSETYTATDTTNATKHIQALMLGTVTVNGAVYGKVYYGGTEKVLTVINNTLVDPASPSNHTPLAPNDSIRIFYADQVMLRAKWNGTKWVFTDIVKEPITTPRSLHVTETSATRIALNWSPVAQADYYKVYVSSSQSGGFAPVKDTLGNDLRLTATSYIADNMTPGTTRYYFVKAALGDGTWEVVSDPSDIVTASTYYNAHIALDFQVADSVQHPSLPIVYLTDKQNKKLFAVNYETGVTTSLALPLSPESLTFANGKIYVSLLKGEHSSYVYDGAQKGAIAIVNASTFSLEKTFDINVDPFDIAVDPAGYMYVASGSGQWTQIKSYSPTTFQEMNSTGIRQASYIEMHPTLNHIYAIDTDSSPRDMEVFNVSNGIFTPAGYDSPYHGDYAMNKRMRISPDGAYLFNGAGTVFSASGTRSDDMKYVYRLDQGFSDIAFELNKDRFYTATDGVVGAYQYDGFEKFGTYHLDGTSKFLYNSPDQILSISQIGTSYAIERINKAEMTVVPPVQRAGIYLPGIVSDIVYDMVRQKAYALDEAFHKLYVVNLVTNAVEQTVSLSHKPSEMTISEDGSKLYIRNNDGNVVVTEISLSNFQELRQLNYQAPSDYSDPAHGQIYQKGNYLYVVTGEWAPRLLVFNATTFAKVDYGTEISSVGDIVFSSDSSQLYYWYQYGWSAGFAGTDVYKISVKATPFTQVDRSQIGYPQFSRDPLDTPMLLIENRDWVIAKDRILNKNNLLETVKVMPEPIYAVSPDGNTLVGKNGLYDAHTYEKLQSLSLSAARQIFYVNNTLYYLIGNTLSHL